MSKNHRPGTLHQAFASLMKTIKVDAPTVLLKPAKAAAKQRDNAVGGYRPLPAANAAKAAGPAPLLAFRPQAAQASPRPRAATPLANPKRHPYAKGIRSMKSAKARRAARPIAAALIAMLLLVGGFFTYRSLRMPKVHVKHVASQWLDQTAGKPRHHAVRHYSTHPHPIPLAHHHPRHHRNHLVKHKHQKRQHSVQVARGQRATGSLHQATYHPGE